MLHFSKASATFCLDLENPREAEFKSKGTICWRKFLDSINTQAMAWLLLTAFSQVFSENSDQKVVENGQFVQGERGNLKLWMKQGNTSGMLNREGTQRPLWRGPREPLRAVP